MATRIQLEIVTPERRVLSQQVDEIRAPGANGGFGVKPGHTAFVSLLGAGRLDAVVGESEITSFVVGEGFVEVAQDKVLVLAESCERASEIDAAEAASTHAEELKKLLAMNITAEGYAEQLAKVEFAAARLAVATEKPAA